MIEIFDMPQSSDEWLRARMGIPTASMFATVLANGKDGGDSKTRKKYIYQLAGEIITDEPMQSYSNAHMERGKVMEDEARSFYAFMQDAEPQSVGFVRNGAMGCSPDSLIGDDGVLEIKTKLPELLIETIFKDKFPAEHVAQCQGALLVTGRQWIDICVFWPKMPPFIKRAYRDEDYLKRLSIEIERFNDELAQIVERVRSYGQKAMP